MANAASICDIYLSQNKPNQPNQFSRLEFNSGQALSFSNPSLDRYLKSLVHQQIHPKLGVLVETDSGELLLSTSHYFHGSHEQILRQIIASDVGIKSILWGGELLTSEFLGQTIIHRANETSGFLNDYNTFLTKSSPGVFSGQFGFLEGAVFESNSVGALQKIKNQRQIKLASDYLAEAYQESNRHILANGTAEVASLRHSFKSVLSRLNINLNTLADGHKASMTLSEIKTIVNDLRSYLKFYILFENNNINPETLNLYYEFLSVSEFFINEINQLSELSSVDFNRLEQLLFEVSIKALKKHSNTRSYGFYLIKN